MKTVTLVRFESSDQGTFGRIHFEDNSYYTLELPWRDNRNDISCIPTGTYSCHMTMSNRFRRMLYLVSPVHGRFAIRIHSANLAGDRDKGFLSHLNGCIALGEKIGVMGKQKALFVSQPAVRKFHEIMQEKPFTLEVINGMG